MSKSNPAQPRIGGSEPAHQPHALELRLQPRLQILVLTAQIEEAARRADRVTGDRHAFENAAGMRSEQHAVLERAGFAFVGVADDIAVGAGQHCGRPPI